MIKKIALTMGMVFAIAGCASTALTPQAQRVVLSPNPPPHGCRYLGSVTGNQGNFVTNTFASSNNQEQNAMNSVKNQAAALGANYVQMLANRAEVNGVQQSNVAYTGNAYNCPRLD